ncbi:MAG: diguanylate cyclase [Gammaproteobacteria bacterium]|nr:diguanylate cyclase [Gammaproteobacteria bacterium]
MKTFFNILDKRSAKFIWRLALLIVLALSCLSAAVGKLIHIELLYFFPITLTSWYGSRKSGVILSLTSSVIILLIDGLHSEFAAIKLVSYGIPYAVGFSALAILITNFRDVHRQEVIAADTDKLTNIWNSRGFYAELANELLRSIRYKHKFSLAYIDIDNFKYVNDSRGHAEGDKLLIEVAHCLKSSLRKTDSVARLGGDEFACLFPESGLKASKAAFAKASAELKSKMIRHQWPVSFSVGLVTFESMPIDIQEAIKVADELMYSVKNADKDNIYYKVWRG